MGQANLDPLQQAESAARQGQFWTATRWLRTAVASDDRQPWAVWIAIAERIGDEHGAVLAAERLRRDSRDSPTETFRLAEALTSAGRADEACNLLAPVADTGRLSDDQCFRLTRMLMFAGRIEEAQSRARGLLARYRDSPTLWERIALTKRFQSGDPDIAQMRRIFRRHRGSAPSLQSAIAVALAKACVDIGDDAEAHRCLEARAEANRVRFPFDARSLERALSDTLSWCERGPADPETAGIDGADRPIFILGPARSGTTLLDQVFSRHTAVRGGGELRHLWLATRELGDCSSAAIGGFDAAAAGGWQAAWKEIGSRYLALADERFGPATRFTDKLLSNVYRVRAIRRCVPDARIVYIRRNPLDVAWSCWRAQLDSESAWNNAPDTIALYIRCYRRMMEAWIQRYPDAFTIVDYETLVRDPGREIPRLLAACGLADESATRSPETAGRPVSTLSFANARGPIDASRVDAAAAFPISTRSLRVALESAGVPT